MIELMIYRESEHLSRREYEDEDISVWALEYPTTDIVTEVYSVFFPPHNPDWVYLRTKSITVCYMHQSVSAAF